MIGRASLLFLILTCASATAQARQVGTLEEQDAVMQCAVSRFGGGVTEPAARKGAARSGAGFDAGYYRIGLDLTSETPGYVEGRTRVVGTVTVPVLPSLELDFHGSMLVDSVTAPGGSRLMWSAMGNILSVDLDPPALAGERVDFAVHYRGSPASTGFGSFAAGTRGAGEPYVWTLSEPYGARTWWPGVDHPSDKADSVDVVVTVPDPMTVASNGLLTGVEPNGDGTTTWTWSHRYPISSYLVSVAAGVYDRFSQTYVRPDSLERLFGAGSFPIEHFAYTGTNMFEGTHEQNGWRRVTDIMPVMEWWYGPYPFQEEKYGHAHFTWGGGMEHQTITSMGGNSVGLIAHELAHQWYGDAVGPRSWPDLWLNEGFATMGELLTWDTMRDRYPGVYESVFSLYWSRARGAQGTLVLEDTSSVGNMFASSRVYAKGGMVLHMLREMVGDATFRAILRTWASKPGIRYGTGSSDDFRLVAEEVAGMNLERFFDQWVTAGTGYPEYSARWAKARTGDGWRMRITLSQVQTATVSNVSVFEMPVVMRVITASGERDFTFTNDVRSQKVYLELDEEPVDLVVDPDRRILRGADAPVAFEGEIPVERLPALKMTSVHPNPVSTTLHIRVDAVGGRSGTLELIDAAGRRVLSRDLDLQPGSQTIAVDVSDLAAGVYVVRVTAARSHDLRTVVVVR